MALDLEQYIASIPNFPKEGILFRDITPILQDPQAFHEVVQKFAQYAQDMDADVIVGPESRGFIFGAAVAYELGIGFVPVRKPGKLPRETISETYDLEYGHNELFMHKDSIKKGQRALIIDDLLATGGTAKATAKMIERLGGEVCGYAFVIELLGLPGREVLKDYDICALLQMTDK